MTEIHHFSYGLLTPALAYVMSCAGSLLGLLCTARARAGEGRSRASWLALAAISIGGTGIWVMQVKRVSHTVCLTSVNARAEAF